MEVPILDDALDEGDETFTLKLTGAQGAAIADSEATGTIKNSDPLQWSRSPCGPPKCSTFRRPNGRRSTKPA